MGKRLVVGVGINDAEYRIVRKETYSTADGIRKQRTVWFCPFYARWSRMLERCYYDKTIPSRPTYRDCSVCEEWLTFSNFRGWMEKQDWEGKQLDKDILFIGNKVYSPETCVFVDREVNSFITESAAARGKYKIGVSWDKQLRKFKAVCGRGGYLGYYDTEAEAHKAWLTCKLEQAKILAAGQTDPRVAEALIKRYENYEGTIWNLN